MTNAEKFKEVFGLEIDNKGQADPCDIIDYNVCTNSPSCPECLIHNFWKKEYKKIGEEKDEN